MTTRNVLAATSTGTAALFVASFASGAAGWLPAILGLFLVLQVVALVIEVRDA